MEDIQINIRTGTSTRNPEYKTENERKHTWFPESRRVRRRRNETIPVFVEFYQDEGAAMALISLSTGSTSSSIESILAQSMQDTELRRDANIQISLTSRGVTNKEKDEICSICQSALSDKVVTTPCNHTFHYPCVSEWAKYKTSCPVCRQGIPVLERT